MPPAAGVVAQGDRIHFKPVAVPTVLQQPMVSAASEAFAKDAIIGWFRGEFAAANAIIDALCSHLTQLQGGAGPGDYESVFAAIHRRRLNWIPILQMQKYFSIADVTTELKKAAEKREESEAVMKKKVEEVMKSCCTPAIEKSLEDSAEKDENGGDDVVDEDLADSLKSEITDTGSQEVHPFPEAVSFCYNHEDCEARRAQIKMTKGFVAKEPVKGHMVNVVRGLKLYEDIFADVELSKLNDFVNDLRVAGQNGELSGETFILYNQQTKGNKRELIQLGVPIFGQIKEDGTNNLQKSYIEPIPGLLQDVIEHLIQWHLIPENKKPNSCIINFFDEGEFSQPFLKPPHLDQLVATLLLSESSMAFGRMLVSDGEGNYRGPLMLSLNEGSLLVMRGNSSDTARHVMCASANKRVSITFFRVRTDTESRISDISPSNKAMTLWQPGVPSPYQMQNNYDAMNTIPKWGVLRTPVVMFAPARPTVVNPRKIARGGTGVFLPWTVGSRKQTKHLPPRAQRGWCLALPSPVDSRKTDVNSDSGVSCS